MRSEALRPMIRSMTGYGTGSFQTEEVAVTAEVRTVNHRFLDLHVRITRDYAFLEAEIQQALRRRLSRGRVDANVSVHSAREPAAVLDARVARSYLEAARRLSVELELDDALRLDTLLTLPGVLLGRDAAERTADPAVTELALKSVQAAIDEVLEMRKQEGAALRVDLLYLLESISSKARSIRALAAGVPAEYRERLESRLQQIGALDGIDPQRLAQEVALLVERSDISEELTRLESHVEQFNGWLDDGGEVGKRMDFLLQELQREINTILSKTSNLEITRAGIGVKSEIEKLREQVQNVE